MLLACAGHATCADLASIRDVLAKGRYIFVIDISDLVAAEATWLLLNLLKRCRRNLRFLLQRSVRTCSHCGAPFSGPAVAEWLFIWVLEGWLFFSGVGGPTATDIGSPWFFSGLRWSGEATLASGLCDLRCGVAE